MKTMFTAAGLALVLLPGSFAARADEKKVPLGDVPKAVADAVRAKYPKAELSEAEMSTEGSKTTYEITLTKKRKTNTVTTDDKGKIEEVETEIAADKLPEAVAKAVADKHPGSKIQKAEKVVNTAAGKKTRTYEVVVSTREGKTAEVSVSAKVKKGEKKEKPAKKPGKTSKPRQAKTGDG